MLVSYSYSPYRDIRGLSAARAWLPLAYNTVIFVMTLWSILPSIRNREAGCILHILLSDGTLYYTYVCFSIQVNPLICWLSSVICPANLVLTVMIIRAPPGLKGVAAQLVFLLTVVMTSRVTLNFRKQVELMVNPSLSGHRQMLFANNPQLRSQCLTVLSSTPTPSISMDTDLTDDAQSFESSLWLNRTCADVESARYEHILFQ
ncbi:uncharacterized protein EDB91DRAFT_234437 [Suillus paluster]|uniref:uncharacterized protein n=1 Tax=Suillus paluster TaxID=48578 RepID=UPI001B87DE0F|nr:uncharacterized protein EDB91DRAFT_234437 [Suillus paluster]KAG1743198.1 hypothetical protein EDB91DRAFT_234437 [Suillus paluster]